MAEHTETKEPMVVYKSELFGSHHVRPLSVWNEIIEGEYVENRIVIKNPKRFTYIPENED